LKHELHQVLPKKTELVDQYLVDGKRLVKQWRLPVSRQLLITRDPHIHIYEWLSRNDISFEVPFGPEGIPWFALLYRHEEQGHVTPAQGDYLIYRKNRPYEHAVTITSARDHGARLFLFGWGDRYVSVVLH
jgi:hypothetical protein